MDLSFWTKLNPNIVYEPTRKIFFDKYLCRLVINCPAGRLINAKTDNIESDLRIRFEYAKNRNWGGSWESLNSHAIANADAEQISNIKSIKSAYSDEIKFRIEEPKIQIYTDSEDMLKVVACAILPNFQTSIDAVQFPESDDQAKLMLEGKIITKATTKIEYKYKVTLRDGEYDSETRNSILQYLTNLGDEVKVSEQTLLKLRSYHYLWSAFLYVNDPSVLTFLSVIQPGIIGKIHELVKVAE